MVMFYLSADLRDRETVFDPHAVIYTKTKAVCNLYNKIFKSSKALY